MKLAVIGATGYTGSRIRDEALSRGHKVTAIVRNADALPTHRNLTPLALDITDVEALTVAIAGHDAVVSAFNPGKDPSRRGMAAILAAAAKAGTLRLLVVGGAGSLEVAPGRRLVDEPDFPQQWKDGALRTSEVLETLRRSSGLNWTFISPAANLSPGDRTGTYRTGGDQLLTDAAGHSQISVEDYAVAMIDEAETPRHPRQRFCVAR
jgi:hypothetical protein